MPSVTYSGSGPQVRVFVQVLRLGGIFTTRQSMTRLIRLSVFVMKLNTSDRCWFSKAMLPVASSAFSSSVLLSCGGAEATVGRPTTPISTSAAPVARLTHRVMRVRFPPRMRRMRRWKFDSAAAKVLTSRRRVTPHFISATRVRLSA